MHTIVDALTRRAAQTSPWKVALVDGPHRLTYAELAGRCRDHAAVLAGAGVRRGDRVAIFLRRSMDAAAALLAAWWVGAVAVVIHEGLREAQVSHILRHSDAACLVTDGTQLRRVPQLHADHCRVIDIDRLEPPRGRPPAAPLIGADLALLIYTSGSTGLPKGVMISHDNLLWGARIVSGYLGVGDRDVLLSVLPFSFDYGLNQLLTAIWAGATLVIQRSLFPPDICATIAREGITGLAGVPTLWQQLTARHSPFLAMTFPRLRYITNTGGRLPEPVVRAIRASHPEVQIFLMYGLTEAFRATFLSPEEVDRRPSSIGKAIPNAEILLLREDGTPCGPGEVGELVQRGATVAMGYWRDLEATARVFRPHPFEPFASAGERVVYSGDLVRMDDAGFLYYVGRRDQQIKSRGIRVSPEEIETAVLASGLVASAVAFAGRAGGEGDDEIVLAVVPADPAAFTEHALASFCKAVLPEHMRPREIRRMADLPLTPSGKPDRIRIRALHAEREDRAEHAAPAPGAS